MIIPMFLVLALPSGCFIGYLYFVDDRLYNDEEKQIGMCCIIPASIFSLCCGCMCNVIAIPIGLLVGPFILAYLVIDWFLSKIRV